MEPDTPTGCAVVRMSSETSPLIRQESRIYTSSPTAVVASSASQTDEHSFRTLTTFSGVFMPVCLSMFSALLFLRIGFVVGHAGLLQVLAQFALAYFILVCTVLSICAISTNGAIEGGGAYYMISRTLGPEFGGSIGALFFFANIFSSALYVTGCVESIVANFGPSSSLDVLPSGRMWSFLYASAILFVNLAVCLIGSKMFARTISVIFATVMVATGMSILSFFLVSKKLVLIPEANDLVQNKTHREFGPYTGLSSNTLGDNFFSHYGLDYTSDTLTSFPLVFGVLFSGVTGIMAGANMSGELKEPARSIPVGTLSAVGFTFVVYLVVTLLTASTCSNFLLRNDNLYLQGINLWPPIIAIGVFAATLSASLSNLIGASRVLEAVAKDDLFGALLQPVVKGTTAKGNPIVAVIISWFIVQLILVIGSLNTIAQVTSVFFLISYCATNLACLGLQLASAPNFRPSFKLFSWHSCVCGLLGTFVMMFVISPLYASGCIILCLVLVIVLHLRAVPTNWGSISQALIFHQVRKYLLILDSRKEHVKFWRPQMLLLLANPRSSYPLIDFVNDLKKSGLYVIGHVKVTTLDDEKEGEEDPIGEEEVDRWLHLIDWMRVKAFIELTVAPSVREGMQHLVRISGLGAMKPNTVVLGFYDESEPQNSRFYMADRINKKQELMSLGNEDDATFCPLRNPGDAKLLSPSDYVRMMQDVVRMKKNLCLCRHFHLLDKTKLTKTVVQSSVGDDLGRSSFIDVWTTNFLDPDSTDLTDTSTLFLLQLACILHMTSEWKQKTRLRVFLCTTRVTMERAGQNERHLSTILNQLRIRAKVCVIMWDDVLVHYHKADPTKLDGAQLEHHKKLDSINQNYLLSANSLLRSSSQQSAVVFMYISSPLNYASGNTDLLHWLDTLTIGLPPTVLVHGVSAVTSTTL